MWNVIELKTNSISYRCRLIVSIVFRYRQILGFRCIIQSNKTVTVPPNSAFCRSNTPAASSSCISSRKGESSTSGKVKQGKTRRLSIVCSISRIPSRPIRRNMPTFSCGETINAFAQLHSSGVADHYTAIHILTQRNTVVLLCLCLRRAKANSLRVLWVRLPRLYRTQVYVCAVFSADLSPTKNITHFNTYTTKINSQSLYLTMFESLLYWHFAWRVVRFE